MIKNVSEKVLRKEIASIVKEEVIIEEKEVVKEEIRIPEELKNGKIRIGTLKTKDGEEDLYYSMKEYEGMSPRIIMGSMGSGKAYYMKNMIKDAIYLGRPMFIIDVMRGSELSESIKAVAGEDRVIEIDTTNEKQMQSFNFNELKIRDDVDSDTKLLDILHKAEMMVDLIDSIGDINESLSVRIKGYIKAVAVLVFYNDYNANLKDICEVLMNTEKRIELINALSDSDKELLFDELSILKKLNYCSDSDEKSNEVKLEPILQRIYILRNNLYTMKAYRNNCSNDIDFVKAINESKIVLIKIPEDKFNSNKMVSFMANFYLHKIGLAKNYCRDKKTELYFDDIGRFAKCHRTMIDLCVEHRMMNLMPVISLNSLNEYHSSYRTALLFIGASIIVLSEYDEKILEKLYPALNNGYTKEDLKNIERYNAMVMTRTSKGYMTYKVKLPN